MITKPVIKKKASEDSERPIQPPKQDEISTEKRIDCWSVNIQNKDYIQKLNKG